MSTFWIGFSDNDCSIEVFRRVKEASSRFLKMKNNNGPREQILFPKRNLWKRHETTDENKYMKALHYLCDQLLPNVPHEHQALVFRLIDFLFFNKIE